ncbi:MAG: 2-oxoacid:acceptor oxidoreductase family protein [Patescibacteria group bacterium]|nr:2-oxoacid:acceptor oxidoreductase family protein [Patescibacteria group bacterium]
MQNIFEIRIHARAQQGANTVAHFLAESIINFGKYAQAFPYFGPERSGSPLMAFVRISDEPIRIYSQVYNPNVSVVIDQTLLNTENIAKDFTDQQMVLVNSEKSSEEINKILKSKAKIYSVDANTLSKEIFGKTIPNTVLLGALIKVLEINNQKFISLDNVIETINKEFPARYGKEMTEKNLQAIKAGYDGIK